MSDNPDDPLFQIPDPISEAFPLMLAAANQYCRRSDEGGHGCFSYHRLWAYRRFLRSHSSTLPNVEHRVRCLRDLAIEGCSNRVLVAGTADYRLFAQVLHAFRSVNIEPHITVLDMCEAPLAINRWYAQINKAHIETVRSDIFAYTDHEPFSAITTDLFLYRIPPDKYDELLGSWRNLLCVGGRIVTREFALPAEGTQSTDPGDRHHRKPLSSFIAQANPDQLATIGVTREQLLDYANDYSRVSSCYEISSLSILRKAFDHAGFRMDEFSLAKSNTRHERDGEQSSRLPYNINATRVS